MFAGSLACKFAIGLYCSSGKSFGSFRRRIERSATLCLPSPALCNRQGARRPWHNPICQLPVRRWGLGRTPFPNPVLQCPVVQGLQEAEGCGLTLLSLALTGGFPINGYSVVAATLARLNVRHIYGVIGIPVTELASAAQVTTWFLPFACPSSLLLPHWIAFVGTRSASAQVGGLHLLTAWTFSRCAVAMVSWFATSWLYMPVVMGSSHNQILVETVSGFSFTMCAICFLLVCLPWNQFELSNL